MSSADYTVFISVAWLEKYSSKISFKSPRGQWVNGAADWCTIPSIAGFLGSRAWSTHIMGLFAFSIISQNWYHFSKLRCSWNPSPWKTRTYLSIKGQCHGCWWPGDARSQGIHSHVVVLIFAAHSGFSTRRVLKSILQYYRNQCNTSVYMQSMMLLLLQERKCRPSATTCLKFLLFGAHLTTEFKLPSLNVSCPIYTELKNKWKY